MEKLILGSTSPRRKEILTFFSLPFEQIGSDFDESLIKFSGNPHPYVAELAAKKMDTLTKKFKNRLILTADTIIYCEGKVYNKPANDKEAFDTLSSLSGKWHSVFTALKLYDGRKIEFKESVEFEEIEETRVFINPLTPEEVRNYHSKIHFKDKAGSYHIQTGGGLIVKKIEGCYYNVMGLPLNALNLLLKKVNINLLDYLKK